MTVPDASSRASTSILTADAQAPYAGPEGGGGPDSGGGGGGGASMDGVDSAMGARAGTDEDDGQMCGVGLALRPLPSESADPRQRGGLPVGVVVEWVIPGGAAAASGLVHKGDVLLSVREAGTGQVARNAPPAPQPSRRGPPLFPAGRAKSAA
jgi:hypothetical protein